MPTPRFGAIVRTLVVVAGSLLVALPAAAQIAQVHVGLLDEDPVEGLAVQWMSAAPIMAPAVVVTTPTGEISFTGALVPGTAAGFVYEARLSGLPAGEPLPYSIEGTPFEVATLPSEPGPLTFVALGDMGVREASAETARIIGELAPDLVLHAGDISYAEGNQLDWATWFDLVEPVASRVPWLPAVGNHEVGPLGIGNLPASAELVYFHQRFALPNNERWYSFDAAGMHFVALDTFSSDTEPSQEQADWLADDLAANADATWTVVFLHEPPYSSNDHGPSARVQDLFVPIFDENGVDLVIGAHDHGYERSHPLTGGNVRSRGDESTKGQGVVYVVTGGGGQSLYDTWEDPAPAWSAARESLFHVTLCTATLEALSCRVVPTKGDPFDDSFRITREARPVDSTTDEASLILVAPVVALALAAALRRRAGAW